MRRRYRILIAIAVLFVLIASYRVLGVYQFRSGECSALPARQFAPTYPSRLTVMTFNIEGHASLLSNGHIEEIAAVIRKYAPDIVGINEAHRWTWQARFHDHIEQLRLLTGMNIVFGRSYTFMRGDFGNAILTKGDILSSDVRELPGTGEPRSLLESVIRINGGTVQLYVTHTTAWGSVNREPRRDQLNCILAHVRSSTHPFILLGDLNAPPDAPEMAEFLARDGMRIAGEPKAPTHRVLEQRLDYILTDPGWVVRSARVLDDGPSDHRPVLAELVHP
ncbi:MAG TPA: endonuclease/exonuclease/phosphatase family protein [Thermoanaerobaculia bacterium]|jgi:endonuclease/exonuclease/phosphatase family metal-dependent hydrolase|nr:endonuclease/exonuclease/phosphatase family protein [Thermoanaerobaculia bacterium]